MLQMRRMRALRKAISFPLVTYQWNIVSGVIFLWHRNTCWARTETLWLELEKISFKTRTLL